MAEALDRYDLLYSTLDKDLEDSGVTRVTGAVIRGSGRGGARLATYATYWIRAQIIAPFKIENMLYSISQTGIASESSIGEGGEGIDGDGCGWIGLGGGGGA